MVTRPVLTPQRVVWWVAGVALAGTFAWIVKSFIGVFVTSIFLYYAARPIFRKVLYITRNRTLSTVISMVSFVVPVLLLIGYSFRIILREARHLTQSYELAPVQQILKPYLLPTGATNINWIGILNDPLPYISNLDNLGLVQSLLEWSMASLGVFGEILVRVIMVLIIVFYLLRDGHKFRQWVTNCLGGHLSNWEDYINAIDRDLSAIFFGNILNAVMTGILAVIIYTTLQLFVAPSELSLGYPAVIGLLCGVASLIPLVGMKLVYVPLSLYLFGRVLSEGMVDLLWYPAAFVGISIIAVDMIPDFILRPYVSSKHIHMGLVMGAYILGPLLFGWYGLFLAPIVLVIGLHYATHILPTLLDPNGALRNQKKLF